MLRCQIKESRFIQNWALGLRFVSCGRWGNWAGGRSTGLVVRKSPNSSQVAERLLPTLSICEKRILTLVSDGCVRICGCNKPCGCWLDTPNQHSLLLLGNNSLHMTTANWRRFGRVAPCCVSYGDVDLGSANGLNKSVLYRRLKYRKSPIDWFLIVGRLYNFFLPVLLVLGAVREH